MAFSQFGQLVNPSMNRGLPPDLAAGEPALDMGLKGADVSMASYYSGMLLSCSIVIPQIFLFLHHFTQSWRSSPIPSRTMFRVPNSTINPSTPWLWSQRDTHILRYRSCTW
jgi:hypothetical protein